jgi:dimethylargininase
MLTAITRAVSPAIADCLLTYMDRDPIDAHKAATQHDAYCALLQELGVSVVRLPADPECPDSVFVEDIAVVADEVAVLARMHDPAREPEVDKIAEVIGGYRPLERIEEPGTLEGGDVIRVGRTFFVGLSTRTNAEGAQQLKKILEPHGYQVKTVAVTGCLHLSTGASHVGDGLMLVNPNWVDSTAFTRSEDPALRVLNVPDDEPWAANTMLVRDTVVMPAGFLKTCAMLERHDRTVRTVDISELMKAEAGLTCMRKLFEADTAAARKLAEAQAPTARA